MKTLVYYLKRMTMHPTKYINLIMFLFLAFAVTTACKKDEPEEVPTDSSPVQQLSKDDNTVEVNIDEVIVDVGQVLSGSLYKSDIPCGATLDSIVELHNKITYYLTYDGLNCPETRYRKGKIQIRIKSKDNWLEPNTKIDVDYIDYEVTNVYNNSKMLINGTSDMRNISGGIPALLGLNLNSVIHKVNARLDIAFDANPPGDYNLHKMMVYSGTPGNLLLAVNGFGSEQGQNNLLSWGIDRNGRKFFIRVSESVVYRQSCQWLPSSGQQNYHYPQSELKATVTFGFNNNNEPISGAECPTRYRVDWQQSGNSGTIFLPLIN